MKRIVVFMIWYIYFDFFNTENNFKNELVTLYFICKYYHYLTIPLKYLEISLEMWGKGYFKGIIVGTKFAV